MTKHVEYTGSTVAQRLLADWNGALKKFVKVMPTDYKRVLLQRQTQLVDQRLVAGGRG